MLGSAGLYLEPLAAPRAVYGANIAYTQYLLCLAGRPAVRQHVKLRVKCGCWGAITTIKQIAESRETKITKLTKLTKAKY